MQTRTTGNISLTKMAFKFLTILALLACANANYIPTGLAVPFAGLHDYGAAVVSAPHIYGSILPTQTHPAHLVDPLARASHLQLLAPLFNNFVNPNVPVVGLPVPQGKTTLSKTFVSTPTYVTSHLSERVHSNERVEPTYGSGYVYGKNVINTVVPLHYGAHYAPQNVPYVAGLGQVY
uniref:Uncharacterized protein n=1 Tax=Anopheles farauti TaxID=69004 RepID=A0A182Q8A4_9DIPT